MKTSPGDLVRGIGPRDIGTVVLTVVAIAVVASVVAAAVPGVVGADASYVVLSSSMAPAIGAGDVVLVNEVPAESVEEGDIITYRRADDVAAEPVTHRVVEVDESDGERVFTTKGDANDVADDQPVRARDVIGRVTFSIPLVGYLIDFGNSRAGLVTLVVVPAVLLGTSELWALYRDATGADSPGGGGETE